MYSPEVYMHRALMNSTHRTLDPEEASLFYVPWYVSCQIHTYGADDITFTGDELITYLIREQPFWNRTTGRDHVFTMTHDTGACKLLREVLVNEATARLTLWQGLLFAARLSHASALSGAASCL